MVEKISRREFLKLSGAAMGGLAVDPLVSSPPLSRSNAIGIARVAISEVKIYKEPSYTSEVTGVRPKDQLLPLYQKLISPSGPAFNPRWWRVEGGFAHTAYLQPVETNINPIQYDIDEKGELFEVSVPLTQSMRNSTTSGWQPLYRLYYKSTHWVTEVGYGPDYLPWYKIFDSLLELEYWVAAQHMRKVMPEELTPISPELPASAKYIIVNIEKQSLQAFENGNLILHTDISTGIPNLVPTSNGIPTATPRGRFNISLKMPAKHMGNGFATSDVLAYELPGVPWVSFFTETGVAFHGTYWHDNYGNEMSHGCVNMRPEEAKWLFRWVTPVIEFGDWKRMGYGTIVDVI